MKNLTFIIALLFLGSLLIISCGPENKVTNQFAKRKYLKKYKHKKIDYQPVYQVAFNDENSIGDDLETFEMEEMKETDNSRIDELSEEMVGLNDTFNNRLWIRGEFDYIPNPKIELVIDEIVAVDFLSEKVISEPKTPTIAIVSFVLGILVLPSLFILGIPALITGAIALNKINKNPAKYKGRGYAQFAVIIGIIGTIGFLIYSFLFFIIAPGLS